MHFMEEVLQFWECVVLLYGVVEHVLSEPVDIDDIMIEEMSIECSIEIAIML